MTEARRSSPPRWSPAGQSPVSWGGHCPASRCDCATRPAIRSTRAIRGRFRPRRQRLLRLLARRLRGCRRRRLVRYRRRCLQRRRRRPAAGRPAQGVGHRQWLQCLPARGGGRLAADGRRPRGGRHGGAPPLHRRGGQGLRGRRIRGRSDQSRTCSASPPAGWPGSSAPAIVEVVGDLPHSATGKVSQGPAARGTRGDLALSARVILRGQVRLPPVRRGPGGCGPGVRADRRRLGGDLHPRRSTACRQVRRAGPGDARRRRGSTTSGGSTPSGCGLRSGTAIRAEAVLCPQPLSADRQPCRPGHAVSLHNAWIALARLTPVLRPKLTVRPPADPPLRKAGRSVRLSVGWRL